MAVTANGTHIIFNDNSTQAAKGSVLGAIQYGSYVSYTRKTYEDFSASEILSYYSSVNEGAENNPAGANNPTPAVAANFVSVGTDTVFCGWSVYRSATSQTGDTGAIDSGTLQVRYAYRSIS